MARLESEASNPVADVMISASWDTADDFAKRGWLAPLSLDNAATVPAFLKNGNAVAQGVSALGIAWNPKSNTPRPSDWSDLARPEYKDLVTVPDPAQSGSSYELVAALQQKFGWKLFEDLKANGAIVAGANADALNPVLQGAKAAVFGAVDYIALAGKQKGESIDVIFPKSGTIVAPRPAMIFKWSKNQADAKAFIDYMLSDDGQKAIAAVQLMPARTDVEADRPLINDLTLLDAKAGDDATRKEILARFASIFAAR
jgi:iron(III) transport system substrate-binding protein